MTRGISPGSSIYPWHANQGETNLSYRQAARKAAMATIMTFIIDNPGCVAYEISKDTGISHSEISRYIRWSRMEWRPIAFMYEMRSGNPRLYYRLLHDVQYTERDGREGVMINTSKREIFDRYCLNQGYNLAVNKKGQCYLTPFMGLDSGDNGHEKKYTLRMFPLTSDDQKKTNEARVCQAKLM